jgi:ribosomal protein S18 acetylase RimI-like enzyme
MAISVKMPQGHEKAHWLPLWQDYLRFYETSLPESMSDLTWDRFQDPLEPMHLLAAYDGGQMLGFASFHLHRSTWAPHYYCYLEDLFVAPHARGKGAGRALILAVKKAAMEAKASRLYWVTRHDNLAARALYESVANESGFVQYRMAL